MALKAGTFLATLVQKGGLFCLYVTGVYSDVVHQGDCMALGSIKGTGALTQSHKQTIPPSSFSSFLVGCSAPFPSNPSTWGPVAPEYVPLSWGHISQEAVVYSIFAIGLCFT
ncbi:hypothetical protein GDO78_021791 [Eleutherodactylus coqui]|uniref:Uncharacterized protein n=1 Tax=Eleutherodactylus coqui TaxID=57060 RepID=A0A8J6EGK1_ELECQ|nr:hypothetical protein GDO78_021791 [Eleutherodactylus coqui]